MIWVLIVVTIATSGEIHAQAVPWPSRVSCEAAGDDLTRAAIEGVKVIWSCGTDQGRHV